MWFGCSSELGLELADTQPGLDSKVQLVFVVGSSSSDFSARRLPIWINFVPKRPASNQLSPGISS